MRRRSVIIALILLVLGLSCVVALFTYFYTFHKSICRTAACKRSAQNLLSSMSLSVDPCDDFYEFSCGNWAKNHPTAEYMFNEDWFDRLQIELLGNISNYLNLNDSKNEPVIVHDARKHYRSCLKAKHNSTNNFNTIKAILEQVKLSVLPPFETPSENFSWVETAVLSKQLFNKDFFVGFTISSDPKNRTVNRLHIGKPSEISPLPVHRFLERDINRERRRRARNNRSENNTTYDIDEDSQEDNETESAYEMALARYMFNSSEFVFKTSGINLTDEMAQKLNASIRELIKFQNKIDELTDGYYGNGSSVPKYFSTKLLQELTDDVSSDNSSDSIIIWTNYFELMFNITDNVELNFEEEESVIVTTDDEYIVTILSVLAETPLEVIEFYMWWTVVNTLCPYTSGYLRDQNDQFFRLISGGRYERPRRLYCADVVNQLFGQAIAYSLLENDKMTDNIENTTNMVENMRTTFLQNINKISWMDSETKKAASKKITAMKTFIGYPKWLADNETLQEMYKYVKVNESDFLGSILQIIQTEFRNSLDEYREPNNFEDEIWISNPMDVNAYNYMEGNAITIPAGILQFPFYEHGLEALNYGSIGAIIGHEMTHSFDNTGKEYDDGGNTNLWWTNETAAEFKIRAQCFVSYYETFKEHVNGLRTLDENIADNGGLRNALIAYRNYVRDNGAELKLPHLEKYTGEQLLFMSFANTWCQNTKDKITKGLLSDEHSPNRIRVVGVLSNSDEFAEAWSCKKGSPMNPVREKCEMW